MGFHGRDYHREGRIYGRTTTRAPYQRKFRRLHESIIAPQPDLGESGTNPHKVADIDTADRAIYSGFADFTWVANSPLILTVINTDDDGAANIPDTLTTSGLTWVFDTSVAFDSGEKRISIYYATPTSGGTDSVKITFPDTQRTCYISVEQYVGMDNTDPIIQTKTGSGSGTNTYTVSFDSMLTTGSELQFSCAVNANDAALAAEPGWTEIDETGGASPAIRCMVGWRTSKDISPSANTTTNRAYGIIGIEIRPAAAASVTIPIFIKHYREQGML